MAMTAGSAPPQPPTSAPRPQDNGLGTAGFILSLIGFLSCGVLSPLGLVFSLAGLFRQPRGLAIAGFILGLLGCAWVLVAVCVIGLSAILSCVGLGVAGNIAHNSVAGNIAHNMVITDQAIQAAQTRVEAYRAEHGALPDEAEGRDLISGFRDAWDRDLRYERTGPDDFDVRSAGPDGKFDTGDDIRRMDRAESETIDVNSDLDLDRHRGRDWKPRRPVGAIAL